MKYFLMLLIFPTSLCSFARETKISGGNACRGYESNLAWHWQDVFDWYDTFNGTSPGRIDAYSLADLQFNTKFPKAKTAFKVGAHNLFNNKIYQAYGSPSVGAIYYVALIF